MTSVVLSASGCLSKVESNQSDHDSLIWVSDDTKSISTIASDIDENYFSEPADGSIIKHYSTEEDIQSAIEAVRVLVLETDGMSDERKQLVKKLVELRLRLEQVKELKAVEIGAIDDLKIVNDHSLIYQNQIFAKSPILCDVCNRWVWTIFQSWYKCKGCMYVCHLKCINYMKRRCQADKIRNETQYIYKICPEIGLASQNYRCAECNEHFTLKSSWMEPRLCDYTGRYFCPNCHKNSKSLIPSRVIHNWDFEEHRVSECSKQFLSLMSKKPNIDLQGLDPKLFNFIDELSQTKRMREEIMIMKEYLMTCKNALQLKLLRKLETKQHFVESSHMYSMEDLSQINDGSLVRFLSSVHSEFWSHIKENCETCRGKGFICEICENVNEIFPFDTATYKCSKCNAVYHHVCFSKEEKCLKCLRFSQRKNP